MDQLNTGMLVGLLLPDEGGQPSDNVGDKNLVTHAQLCYGIPRVLVVNRVSHI